MKIQAINQIRTQAPNTKNNQQNINFKAYVYKHVQKPCLADANPVLWHFNKIFTQSMDFAKRRIKSIPKDMISMIKEVSVPVRKKTIHAFDINPDNRKQYVLFLHGTGQNISHFYSFYKSIAKQTNFAIFAPEYRGFGKNTPDDVSEKTLLEDASAALAHLKKEKNIQNSDIVVIGHSLGCKVATDLAIKNPDLKEMVLISPIDSFKKDMDIKQALGKNVPKYAIFLLEKIAFLSKDLENLYGIGNKISKIKVPTDIIHSKSDVLVDYNSSVKLANKSKNLNSLTLLESGSHIVDADKTSIVTNILKDI